MIRKVTLVSLIVLTVLFWIVQLYFIANAHYTTAFINHLEYPVLVSICLAIPVVALSYFTLRPRQVMSVVVLCLLCMATAFFVRTKLDTTNRTLYRQDFGIGAAYLYVDTIKHHYLLQHVSPFRMDVYIGEFTQDSSSIYIDQTFKQWNQEVNFFNKHNLTVVK